MANISRDGVRFSKILLFQLWILFHFALSSLEASLRMFLGLIFKPELPDANPAPKQPGTSWSAFTKSSGGFESDSNLCHSGLAALKQFLTCRPHLSVWSAKTGISVPGTKLLWDVPGKARKSLSLPITIRQSLSLGTCLCWSRQAVSPASGLSVYVSFLLLCLLKGTKLSALVRLGCVTDGLSTSDLHFLFFLFLKKTLIQTRVKWADLWKQRRAKWKRKFMLFVEIRCCVNAAKESPGCLGFCITARDAEQLDFLSISKRICFVYTEKSPRREAGAET